MRKAAIVVGILVVLIIVVLLVAPAFVDINHYRGQVEAQLQKALARPVSVGQMRLRLLPPRVRVANVVIGEDPVFGPGPFASIPELVASVDTGALIRRELKLQSLRLEQPKVELIRNARGTWNFASLGKTPQQPQAPAPAKKPPQTAPPPTQTPQQQREATLPLSNLRIDQGRLVLVDQQKNFQGTYDKIDLNVQGYAPDKAFNVDAAMVLPGGGAGKFELDARVGPIRQDELAATPVDGKLNMKEVSLAALKALANNQTFPIDGVATGTLSVRSSGAAVDSRGDLKLDNARVRNVQIGYPIKLEYKLSGNAGTYKVDSGKLQLGPTPFSIAGTVNTARTPMTVDLNVSTKDASLSEAARLAAAFGVAFGAGMDVSGRLSADVHAQGPVSQPALNGNLSARNIAVHGGQIKQTVQVPELQLALTPQAIRSNQFTASSDGTRVQAQFALVNYTSASPQVDAALRTANAQLGELIAMAQAYGVTAAEGMSGSGQASLDVRATGPLKNANALNISGTGQLSNAVLRTPSLAEPLKVNRADLRFSQNSMVVQNLAASLASTNAGGNVTISNFAAPRVQFTLNADQVNVSEMQRVVVPASGAPARRASLSIVPSAFAQKPADAGFLTRVTGRGNATIGKIIYDKLLLTNVRSDVELDHGVIRLSPLTAALYGGQQVGSIVVDTRTSPVDVRAETRLQHVEANDLLSAISSLQQTLYGLLNANAQAGFRTTESTNLASTLNGRASLNLNNGRLVGIDLLNQLAQVAQFTTGLQTPGNFTSIVRMGGDFDINRGVAQTNNLQAEIPGGKLAADGVVSLVDQSVSMHLTAVLSREFSQKVGGTQVGGFMRTALANKAGELVIPVIVTGTLKNPSFAPDVQKIAQMKLQNLLPTSSNPSSLTSGILGAVLGGRGQGQQEPQQGIGGIVGAITGQQQQQQQQQPPPNTNQPVGQGQQPPQAQQPNPLQDLVNQIQGAKKKKQPSQQKQPQQQQQPPR